MIGIDLRCGQGAFFDGDVTPVRSGDRQQDIVDDVAETNRLELELRAART